MNKLLTCIEDVICLVTNRFAAILVVVFFTLGAKATDRVLISGLAYEIDKTENVAILVRQDKELQGNIVVPGSVRYEKINYKVKLSHAAFGECSEITSVSLQCDVMYLPDFIFAECTKLRTIELPLNLQILGNSCFKNCTSLETIALPNTLYGIGTACFSGCRSLENIEFPDKITNIGEGCFHQCRSLKDITLNNKVLTSLQNISLYDMDYSTITVHVPNGTAIDYHNSSAWVKFNIQENVAMDIDDVENDKELVDVFSIRGVKVKSNVPIASLRNTLSPGIYIIKGKKVIVK